MAQHETDETTDGTTTKHRLAGMALANGVLVIGPRHWAASVRDGDGVIHTAVRRRPSLGRRVDTLPALRGPLRLLEMLAVLPAVRTALPQSRLAVETPAVAGAVVGGGLAGGLLRRRARTARSAELIGGVVSLGTMLATLKGGEVARYHGAEHKVIGGYEQDIPAEGATKEHERCGTQLAVPMLVANLVAAEGARRMLPARPRLARVVGAGAGLALATEFARSLQRGSHGPVSRLALRIGTGLQTAASTDEPTAAQLEVAAEALAALLAAEGDAAPLRPV